MSPAYYFSDAFPEQRNLSNQGDVGAAIQRGPRLEEWCRAGGQEDNLPTPTLSVTDGQPSTASYPLLAPHSSPQFLHQYASATETCPAPTLAWRVKPGKNAQAWALEWPREMFICLQSERHCLQKRCISLSILWWSAGQGDFFSSTVSLGDLYTLTSFKTNACALGPYL